MASDPKKSILKVQDALQKLRTLRKHVAQFVFFDSFLTTNIFTARDRIIEYKKANPTIEEIDVILVSPGGQADEAYRLIRALRKNFKTVNVIVPFWAKSAATLFSLGANNIIMDEFGEFGPLDAQLAKAREDSPEYDRESALNDEHSVSTIANRFKIMYEEMYIRIYEHSKINIPKTEVSNQLLSHLPKFFEPLLKQIDPYKLGEKKRILDVGGQYAQRILLQFGSAISKEKGRALVDYLIHECPDHGYVIDKGIMDRFINNIYESDHFGEEYKNTLQELSQAIIALYVSNLIEDLSIIDFVEEESKDENKGEDDKATGIINDDKVANSPNDGLNFADDIIKQVGTGTA